MFRTKHLFVFILLGAGFILGAAFWFFSTRSHISGTQAVNAAAVFMSTTQDEEYGVVPTTDDAQKEKSAAFIQRVRALLQQEPPVATEPEPIDEPAASEEVVPEPVVPEEPVIELPAPTSETYQVSSTTPLITPASPADETTPTTINASF